MAFASAAPIEKKGASNRSTASHSRKWPPRYDMLPTRWAPAWWCAAILNRDGGVSVEAHRFDTSISQKESTLSAPPGSRKDMPMTARGGSSPSDSSCVILGETEPIFAYLRSIFDNQV